MIIDRVMHDGKVIVLIDLPAITLCTCKCKCKTILKCNIVKKIESDAHKMIRYSCRTQPVQPLSFMILLEAQAEQNT